MFTITHDPRITLFSHILWQTIVFVHGSGGSRVMFAEHARVLSTRGFRCVC